jgi:hypothetical protein
MSSPGSYYLLGPIAINSEFILAYSQDQIAYFLTLVKGETGQPDDLIFDPRPSGDPNTISNPLIFTVVSNGDNKYAITYTDSSNNLQYVTGIKVGSTYYAGPSSTAISLIPTQTEAAPWPGVPFLAGIQYEMKNVSNQDISWKTYIADGGGEGIATQVKMTNGVPTISTVSTGIRVIPTTWYQKGSCGSIANIQSVVTNETLWVAGATGQFSSGFTTTDDCSVGVVYTYCPPGKKCSTSCKGPCPDSNQSNFGCFFDTTSKGFKCETNPTTIPWYRQPWFIILAIIFAIIVFVLIVFLIFRFTS